MKFNFDKIIGLTSIFVSVSTLLILIYEINLTRRQQYAVVLPYIHFENDGVNSDTFKFRLKNDGLGPGFITEIMIIENNVEYREDPIAYLRRLKLPYRDSLKLRYSNISPGQVIPAGEAFDMLVAYNRQTGDSLVKIFDERVLVQIKYKSIYDEVWQINNDMNAPKKVD